MKITIELLVNSSNQKKRKDESDEQFLLRLTHLALNNKGIAKIVQCSGRQRIIIDSSFEGKLVGMQELASNLPLR